jgi:DNA helicase-2/ATP-dependent DNA helicase PcrA
MRSNHRAGCRRPATTLLKVRYNMKAQGSGLKYNDVAAAYTSRPSKVRAAASAPVVAPAVSNGAFIPSGNQRTFFGWLTTGKGNGQLVAVAGSGKTTTLVEGSKYLTADKSAVFVAFGRQNVRDLETRLEGRMECKTVHKSGFQAVRSVIKNAKVKKDKYREICEPLAAGYHNKLFVASKMREEDGCPKLVDVMQALEDAVGYCQNCLIDPSESDAFIKMCEHYGLEVPVQDYAALAELVETALVTGLEQAQRKRQPIVSFTDMLWLPCLLELELEQYDFVFVDECQDLSAAQLEIVLKMLKADGRIVTVGDPNQAIFGFAGADAESWKKIGQRTKAKKFDLDVCYRCPREVVALAQTIVPHIKWRDDAKPGKVESISESAAIEMFSAGENDGDGDMIICRLTAPLVKLCLQLIAARKPARLRGSEIGKHLTGMVRAVADQKGFDYGHFPNWLETFVEKRTEKLAKIKGTEGRIQSLEDRADALREAYLGFDEAENVKQFCRSIEGLFDDERPGIVLSTIHRAKGLEAPRVFILRPEKLPLVRAKQQKWEVEQERNLTYVAYTRAKSELYFIEGEPADMTRDDEETAAIELDEETAAAATVLAGHKELESCECGAQFAIEVAVVRNAFMYCSLLCAETYGPTHAEPFEPLTPQTTAKKTKASRQPAAAPAAPEAERQPAAAKATPQAKQPRQRPQGRAPEATDKPAAPAPAVRPQTAPEATAAAPESQPRRVPAIRPSVQYRATGKAQPAAVAEFERQFNETTETVNALINQVMRGDVPINEAAADLLDSLAGDFLATARRILDTHKQQ